MEVCVYHALDSINEINRKMPDIELRDLFAMYAMQGFISKSYFNVDEHDLPKMAYELADAMLKARKQK